MPDRNDCFDMVIALLHPVCKKHFMLLIRTVRKLINRLEALPRREAPPDILYSYYKGTDFKRAKRSPVRFTCYYAGPVRSLRFEPF